MKILAIGAKNLVEELKHKLSDVEHEFTEMQGDALNVGTASGFDVIFDLDFETAPSRLEYYSGLTGKPVFVAVVKTTLAQAVAAYEGTVSCALAGINALPTFINRSLAEVSLWNEADAAEVKKTLMTLNWKHKLVKDRVGMVTPRIVFMIINEACYTVQEGTATMADIDTSMKLGTNYPFGPFEWADRIGITHVYETLQSLYEDTKDDRYKICPLLKTLYLKKGTFYI